MSTQTTSDPNNVAEILSLGGFNVSFRGPLATITFCHLRPNAKELFENAAVIEDRIIVARISVTIEALYGLRDLLNKLPTDPQSVAHPIHSSGTIN